MKPCARLLPIFASVLSAIAFTGMTATMSMANLEIYPDSAGAVATFSTAGKIDETGPFFQKLGANGRTCATCHQADQAMSLSSAGVQRTYRESHGRDALFAAIDGANCPTDDVAKRSSHSLLLERGLIRVGLTLPVSREFEISAIHDPYGCAITHAADTGAEIVSVYRRPLPSTNLRFLSALMFDGRETTHPLTSSATFPTNLAANLKQQALDAIQIHSQATAQPTDQQLDGIVNFELGLSTAQVYASRAGLLWSHGAAGGPSALSTQSYYPGSNDPLGADPTGEAFNSSSMTLYSSWESGMGKGRSEDHEYGESRAKIAAGERIFNTAVATITDVRGLNDNPTIGSPAVLKGTCTTCHNTPNVGNHSLPLPLDISTSRQAGFESSPNIIAGLSKLSAPDLPVYEITGCPDTRNPSVKVTYYTSDPGKALTTGKCGDVNRGKGPILRGLAARAPYFHNGAAANLHELVDFYNERFEMNLTPDDKEDLIAFLNSL